ncbi:MAG: hypothetical protein JOY70_02845 [Acidisphaera sp.]|nr:hypothetical protein [Acidisphaera sp.]MBV9812676.1 hypothetical protein [Acetobacteraceae bacterium]
MRQGDERLRHGDIAATRLLYGRAAADGDAQAALSLGKTYDPRFLASIGALGIQPDAATAADWYRKAAALGAREADGLAAGLPAPQPH